MYTLFPADLICNGRQDSGPQHAEFRVLHRFILLGRVTVSRSSLQDALGLKNDECIPKVERIFMYMHSTRTVQRRGIIGGWHAVGFEDRNDQTRWDVDTVQDENGNFCFGSYLLGLGPAVPHVNRQIITTILEELK